jgi:hypothetical protein
MSDLKAFADEIDAADRASRQASTCKLCLIMPALSGARREIIQRGLDSRIGSEKLAKILKNNGLDVGRPTIRTHRSEGH